MKSMYYTFYIIRRTIYGALLAFHGEPTQQITIILTTCVTFLIYQLAFMPYKRTAMNIIATLNEFLVAGIVLCFYRFVHVSAEGDDIELTGWVVIGIAIAMLVINFLFIIVETFYYLFMMFYRWFRDRCMYRTIYQDYDDHLEKRDETYE